MQTHLAPQGRHLDLRHGRTTMHTQNCTRDTGAAMPGSAFVQEAEGWQSQTGPGSCSCAAAVLLRTLTDTAPNGNSHEARWECDTCAGLGTSSGATLELAGPSTAGPEASGQPPGSVELESSSLSTSSQAASRQTLGPPPKQTSSPSAAIQVASGQTL